jgi:hypothetical protein
MKSIETRKSALENQLSKICGAEIELTVRGLQEFTLFTEGDNLPALERARIFLSQSRQINTWKAEFDSECEATFAWFSVII